MIIPAIKGSTQVFLLASVITHFLVHVSSLSTVVDGAFKKVFI